MSASYPKLSGLVLAAGAGTRFGGPKALAREQDGTTWLELAVRMLVEAGCDDVVVALGARASEAQRLVPPDARSIVVDNWRDGVSATLRAGLDDAMRTAASALIVTPVDTPTAPASAVERLLRAVGDESSSAAQAVYDGRPGHPVLIGRTHWAPLAAALSGDRGARRYLLAHGVIDVECGDLWDGADIDTRG